MKIITFGNCCKKSQTNHSNALKAAQLSGVAASVENVSDWAEMARYGVMSTPALAIDGQVVSCGRVLTTEEIVKLIKERS